MVNMTIIFSASTLAAICFSTIKIRNDVDKSISEFSKMRHDQINDISLKLKSIRSTLDNYDHDYYHRSINGFNRSNDICNNYYHESINRFNRYNDIGNDYYYYKPINKRYYH